MAAAPSISQSATMAEQYLSKMRRGHDTQVQGWKDRVDSNEFMKKVAQGISPLSISQGGTMEKFNEQLFNQRMHAGTSYVLAMRLTKRMVKFGREFGFLKLDSKYFQ